MIYIDRVKFYKKLNSGKTSLNNEELIDLIDSEDFEIVMLDKYNQVIEFDRKKVIFQTT